MFSTNKMLALQVRTKMVFEHMAERLKDSERGQTAVEYAGIVFVGALVAVTLIGYKTEIGESIYQKISNALETISNAGSAG